MKTLYQYTIKAGEGKTVLTDGPAIKKGRSLFPIAAVYQDANESPIVAASLLRDLAKWAIEQAEIIEELETGKPIPERNILGNYAAEIVEVSA